jgi:protoheme IX farnesyltransferase
MELTRAYCLLVKPRILFGNLITAAAGFFLASKGPFNFPLFSATLAGLSFVIASACVFNNSIDRKADKKMLRTKERALATGLISVRNALIYALLLLGLGIFCLGFYVNFLTLALGLTGFFVYVLLYSFSKYHTLHGTLIGSVAGAMPPVIGYTAVSQQLDFASFLLFTLLVLWQMPHFFAIAIYRLEDYAAASIPVLPLISGIQKTKMQMLFYIIGFMVVSSFFFFLHYTGPAYLILSLLLGAVWLKIAIEGFKTTNDLLWARKMFVFSLVVIIGSCIALPFYTEPVSKIGISTQPAPYTEK